MKELLFLGVVLVTQQLVMPMPTSGIGFMPRVIVEEGVIVGLQQNQGGVKMYTYRGIPFAQPPEGNLRFMPPEPVEPWDHDLIASHLPNSCPVLAGGHEDCLYLNVYTPANVNETGPLSVMVFIHGGAFFLGSTALYDNTSPLVQHDVIVVTIQYRLGVLGFLSTGDSVVPGNMGLKDQTLALKWIKTNIASFGGDSESITIFGHSAGSASVHFQVLSPYAKGLFNRYILMSGNSFMPWGSGRDFYEVSRDIARKSDCPENPSYDLIVCLQGKKNYIFLNDMLYDYFDWNFQPFRFGPRVDGDFVPDEPAKLLMTGQYSKVPAFMGVVANEMALETGEMYAKPFIIDGLLSDFTYNGPPSLMLYDDEEPNETANTTYEYYLGSIDINEGNADTVTKMYTDRMFHIGLDWLVQQQADEVETYMYQFDYRGTYGLVDGYEQIGLNISSADSWIGHGDDVQYIFASENPLTDSDDVLISCLYSSYYTNFAKYGNPTPEEAGDFCLSRAKFVTWEATNGKNLRHLSISPEPLMTDDTRQEVRTFWESLPLRINAILQG